MTSIESGWVKTVGKLGLTTGSLEKSNETWLGMPVPEPGLCIIVLHPGWFQYHLAVALIQPLFNAPSNRHISWSSFEERPFLHTKHMVGNCFEFARVRHFPCCCMIPSLVVLSSLLVPGRNSDLVSMWGVLRPMAGWTMDDGYHLASTNLGIT